METLFVYPGSFCPPTYGHRRLAERAAELFPQVNVICSDNPFKQNRWFTPAECLELWKTYPLPPNVSLTTFEEITRRKIEVSKLVLIRGLRCRDDFKEEEKVLEINHEKLGIVHYLHTLSEPEFREVSSSRARKKAEELELEGLGRMVSPMVITRLLEKVLGVKNLFLVVGKPASGKSTFLKMLEEESPDNFHLNTDLFSEALKPLVAKAFPGRELIQVFREEEERFKEIIKLPWLEMLKDSLRQARGYRNVFVEAAYGLRAETAIYRLVGGKILYFGCGDNRNLDRIIQRGTPEHFSFVDLIPGEEETRRIARENRLQLRCIPTGGSLDQLRAQAKKFQKELNL